eukprot:6862119-Prymnesium_polylepis.1
MTPLRRGPPVNRIDCAGCDGARFQRTRDNLKVAQTARSLARCLHEGFVGITLALGRPGSAFVAAGLVVAGARVGGQPVIY